MLRPEPEYRGEVKRTGPTRSGFSNSQDLARRERLDALALFCSLHPRLLVLTGAGCSTQSGIPDYRDEAGEWKTAQPISYQDFVSSSAHRRRYWARSMIGWRRIASAAPNQAHFELARLERSGRLYYLVTQNVDGLHQRAGSRRVVDLHGRLDSVVCLNCLSRMPRAIFQRDLERRNPGWEGRVEAPMAPDGDVKFESENFAGISVPECTDCGGIMKPDVVFFGEAIPAERSQRALGLVDGADALLVVGSSLMVFSGYRFAREAHRRDLPIAAINRGKTRADALFNLKIDANCGDALAALATVL